MDKFLIGLTTGLATATVVTTAHRWWNGLKEVVVPGVVPVELPPSSANPDYVTDFPGTAPAKPLPQYATTHDLKVPGASPEELAGRSFTEIPRFRPNTEKYDSGICHICSEINKEVNKPWPRLGLVYRHECPESYCKNRDIWKCPYCLRNFHHCKDVHDEKPSSHSSSITQLVVKSSLLAVGVYYLSRRLK